MNVLIVNDNLMGECNAVGYAMKNMLYGMPDVRFLQYCVDYRPKEHITMVDSIFCKKSDSMGFVLREFMTGFPDWLRRLKKSLKGGKNAANTGNGAASATAQVSALPTGAGQSNKGELLRGIMYVLPCRVSAANLKKVKEFKPEVIYTLAENIRVIKFAVKLSKKLGIPIVYHGMDDWKETANKGAGYLKPFRRILFSRFEKMNKRSVQNIAICEKMADYYGKTYGKPYSYACNCIQEYNEEGYAPADDKSMKIVYSGSLHLHRGEVLQEVAAVVEELNAEGRNISMKILAPKDHLLRYESALDKFPHTEWCAYGFPQEDKMQQLKAADVLLHAEASGGSDVQYAKYSFSTKLPEYFAIGRCVLAFGPKEIASIKYVEDRACGYVAENIDDLKKCIVRLYDDPAERAAFAEQNFKLGKESFSREAVQKTIYDALKKSAEKYALHN